MYLLLLLLVLAAAAIAAVFTKPVAITFLLDSDQMDMFATIKWLSFKLELRVVDYRLLNTAYLFQKKIYAGYLKPGKKGRSKKLFEAMALSNTSAKIAYGFNEPHMTGIFCAAFDFAASLVSAADIELCPEFLPENEFLTISAKTELNAGKTLINIIRTKILNKRRKKHGSAEFN